MRWLSLVLAALAAWPARAAPERVRVGVTPGPEARVMEVVRDVAASAGLSVELVVDRDPARLDAGVATGALDANSAHDLAALDRGAPGQRRALLAVAPTLTLPLAVYSTKVRSLRELGPGDTIAIPGERFERARALLLLHNYGLIQLRDGAGPGARLADVVANPRALRLVPVDSRRLARSLPEFAAAALPYAVADAAGLEPARDGIAMEDARSPFADVLVTRASDAGKPWVAALLAAYRSDAVREFIVTEFRDSVRRPW